MTKHKKTISILFFLVLMSFSFINAQNKNELKNLDDFLQLEADALIEAVNNDINLKEEFKAIKVDYAIKLYSFKEHDYFVDYEQINSFSELISDEFVWSIPTMGNHTIMVKEENNEYEILGVIGPSSNTENSDIKLSTLKADLERSDLNVGDTDYIYVQSHKYYFNIVFFKTIDGDEYVVPYAARPEFLGIKNGVPLKAKDFLKISERHLKDQVNYTEEVTGIASRIKFRTYEIMILSFGALITVVLILKYYKRKLAK